MRGELADAGVDIVGLGGAEEEPLLWEMLRLAAHAEEHSLDEVRADPELARYVRGWGRSGDRGVKALDRDGRCVGAAWLRRWRPDDRGFGYVDEHTPELAIAVTAGHRGSGVGSRLLDAVLDDQRGVVSALSLSVRRDNPARRLYHRYGFREVDGSGQPNRVGGSSITMRLDLAAPAPGR